MADEHDVVHAAHSWAGKRGRTVSARFDTVLVNGGRGEYSGITGEARDMC